MSFHLRSIRTAALVLIPLASAAFGASRSARSAIPIVRSELPRDTAIQAPASDLSAVAAGNRAFAIDAYKLLAAAHAGQNVFFSPYSISMALSMAYAGAVGQTADEMAAALRFSLPRDRLHRAMGALDSLISSRADDGVVLEAANSLWARKNIRFEKPFLDTLAQRYGAGVRLADFAGDPEGSRERINAWVADETRHKIRDLLGAGAVDRSTVFVLANAVYFRGDWLSQFEPRYTCPGGFSRLDGSRVQVPTMHKHLGARVSQTAAFDAVELSYRGGKVAMNIVMPSVGGFAAFESSLTGQGFESVAEGLKADEIELSIPKFELAGAPTSVKSVLRGLGMSLAFDPHRADFSGIASDPGQPMFLGDIAHAATVAVDEKGTEAAAATAIDGVSAAPPPPIAIRIDHPFFFVLRDLPTGTILFAGRVTDPTRG